MSDRMWQTKHLKVKKYTSSGAVANTRGTKETFSTGSSNQIYHVDNIADIKNTVNMIKY